MSKVVTLLFCAAVAGAGSFAVVAQTVAPALSAAGGLSARADMKRGERKFLERVAEHSIAEVQSGKIAEARGTNPEVKKFGQMMAQDHGRNYREVVQLAKAKGISLPGEPDRGHKKEAAKLQKLAGAQFDLTYMSAMVKDHQKDVKAFEKMSRGAKDPDVKAFAARTLPVLVGHLQAAREIYASARGK